MRGFLKKKYQMVEKITIQKLSRPLFYLAIFIIGLLIFFLILPDLKFNKKEYLPLSIASSDVIIDNDTELIDTYTSNLIKQQTIEKEGLFFRRQPEALDKSLNLIANAFNKYRQNQIVIDQFREKLNRSYGQTLNDYLKTEIEISTTKESLALNRQLENLFESKPEILNKELQAEQLAIIKSQQIELEKYLEFLELRQKNDQFENKDSFNSIENAEKYLKNSQQENLATLLNSLSITNLDPNNPAIQSKIAEVEIEKLLADAIMAIYKMPFIDKQSFNDKPPSTNVKVIEDFFDPINLGSILGVPNKQQMISDILKNNPIKQHHNIVKPFLEAIIQPNLIYDQKYTQDAVDRATADLREVKILLKKGEILVRKGEKISPEKARILDAYQKINDKSNQYPKFISVFLMIWFMIFILMMMVKSNPTNQDTPTNKRKILLISLSVLLIQLAVCKVIIELSNPIFDSFTFLLKTTQLYILPIGIAPILVAVLINRKITLTVGMISAVFASMLLAHGINSLIFTLASNFVTASLLARSKIVTRSDIISLGGKVSIANAILASILSLNSLTGQPGEMTYIMFSLSIVYAALGGLIAAFLSIIILPVWEYMFDIKTDIKMLEWSTTNHPLLKELLDKAPGSYHHSMAVGSISEAGALKIGARAIFCRIASYFHDIGKTYNPSFFIENMRDASQNPHILMDDPIQSKDIIIGHVSKGIELAKKYDLGKQITDIIQEHHGTSLVKFFYLQTKRKLELGLLTPSQVSEKNFRYPGPKPQTPESALIMLADVCESTVRSIKQPTIKKIKEAIKSVSTHILEDGQLDESRISLKDFKAIQSTYTDILIAQHHARIPMPGNTET